MSATNQSPETVLRQIDAIMGELQTLRQTVQALLQAEPQPEHLSEHLSAWDIIQAAPGQRQFHTPEDVAHYLREERGAWED
jgi:hypothetical protein